MVTFALSDQNIEQRVASLIKEQLELHNKEWTQKLEDQKQEFEAKLRILENSCQVKNVQTSSVAFDGHEYPGDIEERVTRLEGFHDLGFNGKYFQKRPSSIKSDHIFQIQAQAYFYLAVSHMVLQQLCSTSKDIVAT